jgi:hypothetical protein
MKTLSTALIAGAILTFGAATTNAQTGAQPGQTAPSTVDGNAQQQTTQPQPPKTTGAMDNAVGGVATSPQDVKRQTDGLPTAAQEAKGVKPAEPKPGMTEASPGTVGAAPGATPAPAK